MQTYALSTCCNTVLHFCWAALLYPHQIDLTKDDGSCFVAKLIKYKVPQEHYFADVQMQVLECASALHHSSSPLLHCFADVEHGLSTCSRTGPAEGRRNGG